MHFSEDVEQNENLEAGENVNEAIEMIDGGDEEETEEGEEEAEEESAEEKDGE